MDNHSINTIVPQLRFHEFLNDGEWEVKRLGEIAEKVTSKNKSNEQLPVLTNSATEGVVNQQDYFDREIVTRENLTNYHIIELNDFVYNPRISVAAPVGPISRNKIGIGIMSPLYTIFKFKEGNIDFFEQYFRTNCWHQYLKDKANFGARFDRMNISNEDFFNLPMPFPPLAEQRRIAQTLTALDELIAATNEKLEQMKAYKKGLMQQLFVNSMGGGKLLNINYLQIPKLRFPEFYDEKEWEEKKLGEIITTISPTKKLQSSEYKIDGVYPIVDQSQNYICGHSNDVDALINTTSDDLVVFGDHTCTLKFIDFPFIQGADGIKIFHSSNPDKIDNRYLYQYLLSNPLVSKEYKRHFSELKEKTISFPTNIEEQRKIASYLSSMDDQINAYTEKVGLLGKYKKGLMQGMFPQNQMN